MLDTLKEYSSDILTPQFDAAILATHPEQIGDGEQEEMFAEERIPSDPMKVKLIGESVMYHS